MHKDATENVLTGGKPDKILFAQDTGGTGGSTFVSLKVLIFMLGPPRMNINARQYCEDYGEALQESPFCTDRIQPIAFWSRCLGLKKVTQEQIEQEMNL